MRRIVPIKGYEKEYMISDDGMVFRIKSDGLRAMKPYIDRDGYYRICLCKGNTKRSFIVHRLVAEMFIPKTDDSYTVVNHKDENKQNNNVDNLEWCTIAYNNSYNNGQTRRGEKRRKPVIAFKDGESIRFDSVTEACKVVGAQHGNIVLCIQGKRKTTKGYSWRYA